MRAVCWHGTEDVRVDTVPDPEILDPRDAAIDRVPERLDMAKRHNRADTIDFDNESVSDRLMELTGGRGPDRCIDAVGTEAHGTGFIDSVVEHFLPRQFMDS